MSVITPSTTTIGGLDWGVDNYLLQAFAIQGAQSKAANSQDLTGSVYGQTIPLAQGLRLVPGVPIWFGPLVQTTQLWQSGDTTNNMVSVHTRYSRNFAVAFGYNLAPAGQHADPVLRRLFVNGQCVYDPFNLQPVINPATVIPATVTGPVYGSGPTVVSGQTVGGVLTPSSPTNLKPWLSGLSWVMYPGSETQTADPVIAKDKGDLTGGYRGMIYMVFQDMGMGDNVTYKDTSHSLTAYNPTPAQADFQRSAADFALAQQASAALGLDDSGNAFPTILAEFADGITMAASVSTYAPASVSDFPPTATHVNNWGAGLIKSVRAATPNTLHTFDINAGIELPIVTITGNVDGAPIAAGLFGGDRALTTWEKLTNVILQTTSLNNSAPVVAIDATTGVIKGQIGATSGDLSPRDINHLDPYVTKANAVWFPLCFCLDIAYVIDGAPAPVPLVYMGTHDAATYALDPVTGIPPTTFPYGSFHRLDTVNDITSITAMPLGQMAAAQGTSSIPYQDAAFLVGHGSKVDLVFCGVRTTGAGKGGAILGNTTIFDASATSFGAGATILACIVDPGDNGIVIFYSDALVQNVKATKKICSYQIGGAVPVGWRGLFPTVGGNAYDQMPMPAMTTNDFRAMNEADVSTSQLATLGTSSVNIIDLAKGTFSLATSAGITGGDPAAYSWSSKYQTLYFSAVSTFNAVPVGAVSVGTAYQLKDFLKWMALRAGYTNAQISVDTSLTDAVDGMFFTAPVVADAVWNSMGAVYDFTQFESEGLIKFVPASHNPLKATSTLRHFSLQPADGNAVQIGATVYTFKNNPSAPFDVKISTTPILTLTNLQLAIGATGKAGTNYASGTTANKQASAQIVGADMLATAAQAGVVGNTVVTLALTSPWSWTSATLVGGAPPPVPSINLTADNMAHISEGNTGENEVLLTTLGPPSTTPGSLGLTYYDEGMTYQVETQKYTPDAGALGTATSPSLTQSISIPVVMTSAEAYRRVSKLSIRASQSAITQEFRLPWKFLQLEPSDVVSITVKSFQYIVRLDEVTMNGDYSLSCSGYNYSYRDDMNVPDQLNLGLVPRPALGFGDSTPVALDTPLIDPAFGSTPGFAVLYTAPVAALLTAPFSNAALSLNNTITTTPLYSTSVSLKYGTAQDALPDTTLPFLTDNATVITVVGKDLDSTMFKSGTQADMLAGKNCILVGDVGRWEYIYFRDVTVTSSKVIKLSGLVRGMRGTENNTGSHLAGDRVYLVASLASSFSAPLHITVVPSADVGKTYTFTSYGTPQQSASPGQSTTTIEGESLKPFAPCRLKAVLAGGNDLNLSWLRRDRLGTQFVSVPQPMSETAELYDLEIMNGASVVRTLTNLSTPAYTYTSANQVSDGFSVPQTTIKIAVYQKGELGRGFKRLETVNVQ